MTTWIRLRRRPQGSANTHPDEVTGIDHTIPFPFGDADFGVLPSIPKGPTDFQ